MDNPLTIDSASLFLGECHHGWLPVKVTLGDFELDVSASNVLNDPLEELVDLAAFAYRARSGFRRVCFWLEPAGYSLDVRQLLDMKHVWITLWAHDDVLPPMGPMNEYPINLECTWTCPRATFYSGFREGLQQWAAQHSAGAASHWRIPSFAECVSEILALPETIR